MHKTTHVSFFFIPVFLSLYLYAVVKSNFFGKTALTHVGQIDQIDHDLDNLDPNLFFWGAVQDLCVNRTDPTQKTRPTVEDHADYRAPTRQRELQQIITGTDQASICPQICRSLSGSRWSARGASTFHCFGRIVLVPSPERIIMCCTWCIHKQESSTVRVPYTVYSISRYHTPLGRFFTLDISAVGIVSVSKGSALETSRQELPETYCLILAPSWLSSIRFFYFFIFFKSSGGWVKIKLKVPHFHVSDTCRVSI